MNNHPENEGINMLSITLSGMDLPIIEVDRL